MDTVMTRGAAAPLTHEPAPATFRIRRLLSAILHATLGRVPMPQRDVPPEYYRFPLF